jgi:hypothetical protein
VHAPVLVEHANGAVLDADRDRAVEQLAHLLGWCGGGDVPFGIAHVVAEQRVADGAAHRPRLEAGLLEASRDATHHGGDRQTHPAQSSFAVGGDATLCREFRLRRWISASMAGSPDVPVAR